MVLKKKLHPRFFVPNVGTIKRSRVKDRWRKQRGIDSKKRVKKNFAGAEPTIGYRNPASIRGIRANGKRIVVVHNIEHLKEVLKSPDVAMIDITIARVVSRRKRIPMIKLAHENNVAVTNGAI